jgi:hypothetical protein
MTLWIVLSAAIFFAVVFAIVMSSGIRLTGKQIEEDPDARKNVEPDKRDADFPVDVDY